MLLNVAILKHNLDKQRNKSLKVAYNLYKYF